MIRKIYLYTLILFALSACEIKDAALKYPSLFRIFDGTGNEVYALTADEVDNNTAYMLMGSEGLDRHPVFIKTNLSGNQLSAKAFKEYTLPCREFRPLDLMNTKLAFLAKKANDTLCALVMINSNGVLEDEILIPTFDNPTYLLRVSDPNDRNKYHLLALGSKVPPNKKLKPYSALVRIDPLTKKILDEKKYYGITNGDEIDMPDSPPRILSEIDGGKGYTFIGYKDRSNYPYVFFVDQKGTPLDSVRSNSQLINYSEISSGVYAALYGKQDGMLLRVHNRKEFGEEYYRQSNVGKEILITELNGSRTSFVRLSANKTELLVTGSTNLSAVGFFRYNLNTMKLIDRHLYGDSDNQYYSASRAREMADGNGYLLLMNTKVGFQRPINKMCLVKTNADGSVLDY
jgi:hypothetical protein